MPSRIPADSVRVTRLACVVLFAGGLGSAGRSEAQTFVQLPELGQGLGPRITKTLANQKLGVDLFGEIGTKVNFIDYGTVYQFASDPSWGRVLSGRLDRWIHEFTNASHPGGRLKRPMGVDVSARKRFYIADRSKGGVLLADFYPSEQNIAHPWSSPWSSADFPRPVDVAWDGRTAPLSQDYLYVLDDSLSRVTYWDANLMPPPTFHWRYGSAGSAVGQFRRPSGVCAGKTAASNGGTQFTTYFYVVDRGNRRVVWLNRTATGPNWLGTASLTQWDPTDCTVDHFGNLYVTDEANHRIHKFTYSLALLDTYGTYGTGTVFNTFAFPRAISVPCGLKVVNSVSVWYCEGRVVTAEAWTAGSGAVEHYLGVTLSAVSGPTVVDPGRTYKFTYEATDHAYHSWWIVNEAGMRVTSAFTGGLRPSGTPFTEWWYGIVSDGSVAPAGNYQFEVRAQSAYGGCCGGVVYSASFYHEPPPGTPPPPPPPPPPECPPQCAKVRAEAVPQALFLRQRVFVAPRPLARLEGPGTGASDAATTASGGLTEAVRRHGVRGLSFGVTRAAASSPLAIRIYSLSGRLVRVLVNERVNPGFYEVAWDGVDDRGRPASPGVYNAVMTIGSYRATQRLILRQP